MVSIIVVTFNDLVSLRRCLESIRTSTSLKHEIVVVDNGSQDGTASFLKKRKGVRLLRNQKNLGLARALNQGLANVRGEFVLLLNDDAFLLPHTIERLLMCFREHPRTGLVGPMTNVSAQSQRFTKAALSHTDGTYFARRLGHVLGPAGALLKTFGAYRSNKGLDQFYRKFFMAKRSSFRTVPCLIGLCLLGRRRLFKEVGPFDERFRYAGFEDFDYCLQTRLAGYLIRVAEHAYIHHDGSRSYTRHPRLLGGVLKENERKFIRKWRNVPEAEKIVKEMIHSYES